VGVVLDLNNHGLLLFYLNDVLLGVAASGLTGPLCPAVTLYHVNDRVVLQSRSDPPAFPVRPVLPVKFLWDMSTPAAQTVQSSTCLSLLSGGANTVYSTAVLDKGTHYWECEVSQVEEKGGSVLRMGIVVDHAVWSTATVGGQLIGDNTKAQSIGTVICASRCLTFVFHIAVAFHKQRWTRSPGKSCATLCP
jgi:hypothetical protein